MLPQEKYRLYGSKLWIRSNKQLSTQRKRIWIFCKKAGGILVNGSTAIILPFFNRSHHKISRHYEEKLHWNEKYEKRWLVSQSVKRYFAWFSRMHIENIILKRSIFPLRELVFVKITPPKMSAHNKYNIINGKCKPFRQFSTLRVFTTFSPLHRILTAVQPQIKQRKKKHKHPWV